MNNINEKLEQNDVELMNIVDKLYTLERRLNEAVAHGRIDEKVYWIEKYLPEIKELLQRQDLLFIESAALMYAKTVLGDKDA